MKTHSPSHSTASGMYGRLVLMVILSFVAMYVLMYAMVDRFENVYMNVNQVYMAGLMAAPMAAIELAVMAGMYPNRRLNTAVALGSVAALVLFWTLIRQQAAVFDGQFLRSMIPHHAGAILMCEEAPLRNPDLQALCKTIITDQQREIDQMKAMLSALDR